MWTHGLRLLVAEASARSERRIYIVRSLFRHQSRYVQYVGQATRAKTLNILGTDWKLKERIQLTVRLTVT